MFRLGKKAKRAILLATAAPLVCLGTSPANAGLTWKSIDPVHRIKKDSHTAKKGVKRVAKVAKPVAKAVTAVHRFTVGQTRSTLKNGTKAANLAVRGKPLKKVVRAAGQPLRDADDNAFVALQSSSLLTSVVRAVVVTYSGPAGTTALEGWMGYHTSGGKWSGAFKSAALAAASTQAFDLIGSHYQGQPVSAQSVLAHGATGGTLSVAQGGKFKDGFLAAGVNKIGQGLAFRADTPTTALVAASATGCVAARAGGGTCEDGAQIAFVATSLNELEHPPSVSVRDVSTSRDPYELTDDVFHVGTKVDVSLTIPGDAAGLRVNDVLGEPSLSVGASVPLPTASSPRLFLGISEAVSAPNALKFSATVPTMSPMVRVNVDAVYRPYSHPAAGYDVGLGMGPTIGPIGVRPTLQVNPPRFTGWLGNSVEILLCSQPGSCEHLHGD